ncbi:hypothetical protein [Hymenobacter sp. B81]|uniref:hypothetical protein n=1 Tax=Hymenobacter sp. B81 TaxID=3344878 RepID=UPI0037DD2EA1
MKKPPLLSTTLAALLGVVLSAQAQTQLVDLSSFSSQPRYFMTAWLHDAAGNQYRVGHELVAGQATNTLVIQKADAANNDLFRDDSGFGSDTRFIGAVLDNFGNVRTAARVMGPVNYFGIPFTPPPGSPGPENPDFHVPRKAAALMCHGDLSRESPNNCLGPGSDFWGFGLPKAIDQPVTLRGYDLMPAQLYTVVASEFVGAVGPLTAVPNRQSAAIAGHRFISPYGTWWLRLASEQLRLPDHYAVSLDPTGAAYVTASFRNAIQVGQVTYNRAGVNSAVIVLEHSGAVRRVDILPGVVTQSVQAAPEQPGAYYVVGRSASLFPFFWLGGTPLNGQQDFWLRTDPSGTVQYAQQPYAPLFSSADILSIKTDPGGNVYQVLRCRRATGFGPITLPDPGGVYVVAACYTPAGKLRWVRTGTAGSGALIPQSFTVDAPDQLSVVVDTPPGSLLRFSPAQLTTRPGVPGNTLLYGATLGTPPLVASVVRRITAGTVTFTFTGLNLSGAQQAWVGGRPLSNVTVDANGTRLTGTTPPGLASYGYGVVETPAGFGASPTPASAPGPNNPGRATTPDHFGEPALTAYPTVSEGWVRVSGAVSVEITQVRVELADMLGRVQRTSTLPTAGAWLDGEISTRDLAPGPYLLRVHNGGARPTQLRVEVK